jgi:hypothetical protein
MHSARLLLLGQGHAAARGMRANEDGVAASLPVQSHACTLPTATIPGLTHVAVGCSISSAPHALRPCPTHLHTHPLCMLPRTISRRFQHGARVPLSRGCNTNAARRPRLSTPQRSTRGVAPRNTAARVAKATMDLFKKTNEM